ncbi:uncharacterized protein J3D65DRAFT_357641 [Phyllosticta citribraziliensis]|uniref:F-box domain-containing protein n=1 Tax=Phyllosticta citribraziliensis TaxID=989973 RepID=A0ABR1LNY9_9PEZI
MAAPPSPSSSSPNPPSPSPSRLLALPAELRLRIYAEALTARDATIRLYFSLQREQRTQPGLGLGLLRTCRQVRRECGDLVFRENEVCVYADCFKPDAAPLIGHSQLPPHSLRNLRTLFLLLDATTALDSSLEPVPSPSSLSNFSPLSATPSLQRLRVAVVVRRRFVQGTQWWKALLARVVERVPPRCSLQWGVEEGNAAQRTYVDAFLKTPGGAALSGVVLEEVPREVLMRAAAYAEVEQGALCGKEGVGWDEAVTTVF